MLSKNLNISRAKQDKFVKQKAFCGEGNRHCAVCIKNAYGAMSVPYCIMEKISF
jgi:hypothetical protein